VHDVREDGAIPSLYGNCVGDSPRTYAILRNVPHTELHEGEGPEGEMTLSQETDRPTLLTINTSFASQLLAGSIMKISTSQFQSVRKLVLIVSACLAILSACSHGLPVTPDATPASSCNTAFRNSHSPWGAWSVTIDPVNFSVELTSLRQLDSHWNITGFIRPPSCPGCITFDNLQFIGSNKISLSVSLQHPFPGKPALDGFDIRGICLGPPAAVFASGSLATFIGNPDGYTSRWSSEPWADINPFIDFATDQPDRRFAHDSTHSRDIIISLPGSGAFTFGYIIDACWLPPDIVDPSNPSLSQHCNEACDIAIDVSGPLNPLPGSTQTVTVEFLDWQNDGPSANVSIEIPGVIDSTLTAEFKSGGPTTVFSCPFTNQLDAPPGDYPALVKICDALNNPENDSLAAWALTTITVTANIPDITGIVIVPDAVSLPEKNSTADFDLRAICSDGSTSPITDPVDWHITGTDLNEKPLACIISDGTVTRLTSRWWGGTASVTAEFSGYIDDATVYCDDPFADAINVDFGELVIPGEGFAIPEALLGPPSGNEPGSGSLTVCSLGYGGVATLEFTDNIIINGDGPDFIVFENAFNAGGCDWNGDFQHIVWNETAVVEVSQDGTSWLRMPCDFNPDNITCVDQPYKNPASFYGIAGNHPVYASVDPDGNLPSGIDPTDPANAGGDAFDLADVGLEWCRYVRLTDTGRSSDFPGTQQFDDDGDVILDFGKMSALGASPGCAGFDGDSVAAVHSASPLSIN